STIEFKKQLIENIQETDNDNILKELYRLLEIESEAEGIYKLNEQQIIVIEEARSQIKNGQFLENDQANIEIQGWLKK
ncbi:MAG: hypothetical protein M3Q56_08450, partial [Bacteroidota bacterium]|nr:hypothetical protein [Bacteroidota bacterium]